MGFWNIFENAVGVRCFSHALFNYIERREVFVVPSIKYSNNYDGQVLALNNELIFKMKCDFLKKNVTSSP